MFDDGVAHVPCIRVFYLNAVLVVNMAMAFHNLQLSFPEGPVSALSSYDTGLDACSPVIAYRSLTPLVTWTCHHLCVFFSRKPCMVCFLIYLFHHQQGDKVQICFVQVLGNGFGTCRILSRTLLQSFDLMVYPAEHSVTFLGCSAGYSAKMSLSTVCEM